MDDHEVGYHLYVTLVEKYGHGVVLNDNDTMILVEENYGVKIFAKASEYQTHKTRLYVTNRIKVALCRGLGLLE